MAIIDVVRCDIQPDNLAWKYRDNDHLKAGEFHIRNGTQVIVNEAQEVVFVKEGKILDILPPGRHKLSTQTIPLLSKIVNIPYGGTENSPFTAEIWYINKLYSLDVKWGTTPAIQLQDPKYKLFITVMAHGSFGIQVEDSRKFMTKLVGTLANFERMTMVKFFRGLFVSHVKNVIGSYLVKKNVSILEINAYITEISKALEETLSPELSNYGIKLANFYVTSIEVQESDPTVRKLKDVLVKKAEMDIVGYDYNTEKSFDVLENVAKNEGSGSDIMNAGLGLGMGMGVARDFGTKIGGLSSNINMVTTKKEKLICRNCRK